MRSTGAGFPGLLLWPTLLVLFLNACREAPTARQTSIPGGNAERGKTLIDAYGCGACHRLDGIPGANGVVGPSLDDFARRTYIAGELPNVPSVLIPWLKDPSEFSPGTGMPDVGLDSSEARDIATWLYGQGDGPHRGQPRNVLALGIYEQSLKEQRIRDEKRLGGGNAGTIPIAEAMEQIARTGS